MPDPKLDLSLIIPVYRNADTLIELYHRASKTLASAQINYEIIFVDDACPEESLVIIMNLAQTDDRVKVIALEHNSGQHRSILVGLAHARGKVATILDADLQDPPEAIPQLLEKMAEGYAVVFAGRRGQYEARLRLLTSRIFKYTLYLACGLPPDAGIYMVINEQAIKQILNLYAPEPFVVAMAGCSGLSMTSLPVERAVRSSGKSAYSSLKRLRTGLSAVWWALRWKYKLGLNPVKKSSNLPKIKAIYGGQG